MGLQIGKNSNVVVQPQRILSGDWLMETSYRTLQKDSAKSAVFFRLHPCFAQKGDVIVISTSCRWLQSKLNRPVKDS